MYKSGQLAPPIILRAKEWPRHGFDYGTHTEAVLGKLKMENLVVSSIVQKVDGSGFFEKLCADHRVRSGRTY